MDDQFPKENHGSYPWVCLVMYMTTKYSWVLDSQTPDNFDEIKE